MDLGNMAGGFSRTFFPMMQQKQQMKYQSGLDAWKQKMEEDRVKQEQDRYNLEQKRYNDSLIDVTPEILNNLPDPLKPMYAPIGGTSSGTPSGIEGIYVRTPGQNQKIGKADYANIVANQAKQNQGMTPYEAEKLKIDWYNAKNKGASTPKDPYVSQIMDMYKSEASRNGGKYDSNTETWTFPNGTSMPSVLDWARQNLKPEDFKKFSTTAFGSDYSLPSNINPTVQKSPVSYRTNNDFSREDFNKTYQDVQNFGGPGSALNYYLKTKTATPQQIAALLDRFNQAHGTNLDFNAYVTRFAKQIAASKGPKNNTQLASR